MLAQATYASVLGAFAAAVVDDTVEPLAVNPATRMHLSVYRNNARANRIAALTDAFANVVQLVGTDYFHALARAYVDCTPAKSANLHEEGADLAAFVRNFEPAADLPYLADIADADWLLHRAYFAADADTIDSASLAALGPERFAAASIRLAPSVAFAHSSRWPIADILQMHAGGETADLGAGGQSVLIWREAYLVRWKRLGHREAEAIAALMNGTTIETAFADTGADANSLLAQLFGHRLVQAIEEPRHENRP